MDSTAPPPSIASTHHQLKLSFLVVFNATLMLLGSGGPFLLRLYFVRGGHRMWLSAFLQVCAWPILLLPLSISHLFLPATTTATRRRCRRFFLLLPPSLTAACAVLGLLIAVDSYIYSYASSYLPLSTSSILMASQLAFTAVFALLIVRQRFTPFSLNAVVLLTIGPAVLGLGVAGDRPEGESRSRYYLGFFMTVAASALMGLLLPLMELAYRRTREEMTYAMVIETQMVMGASGTLFCLLGMLVSKDFQVPALIPFAAFPSPHHPRCLSLPPLRRHEVKNYKTYLQKLLSLIIMLYMPHRAGKMDTKLLLDHPLSSTTLKSVWCSVIFDIIITFKIAL